MIDRTMKTQEQNTRGIDYDNYPVIDLGRDIPLNSGGIGRFEILRPNGKRHGIYRNPDVARCDFRWYMEHYLDTPYGAK